MKYIFSIILSSIFFLGFSQIVETPVINYVTVNNISQKPVVSWNVDDNSLIDGFIIKRLIYSYPGIVSNTYNTVTVINDNSVFSFEDNSVVYGDAVPYQRTEVYRIVAFKNVSGNTFYSLMSNPHKTIFLKSDYDYCKRKIFLNWNKYQAWGNNITGYKIFSVESGIPVLIKSLGVSDSTSEINITFNKNYEFYIEAEKNDGTLSVSNIVNEYTNSPVLPEKIKADSILCVSNKLQIYFSVQGISEIGLYTLFRKQNNENIFDSITDLQIENGNSIFYLDSDVNFEEHYKYYIEAKDLCQIPVKFSDTAQSILLKSTNNYPQNRENSFFWNTINPSNNYLVYRKYSDFDYELIANITDTFFVDDVSDILNSEFNSQKTSGIFQYKVISISTDYKASSNEIIFYQNEAVFFPNAINPKSNIEKNRTFKPDIAFVSDYILSVYDYNGNLVFESKNPETGWDGKFKNGNYAPQGTYIYYLKYKTSEGIDKTVKNLINLIISH
jgi:hypothetical protein